MDDEDFLAAVEADNANVPVEEPKEPETPEPEAPAEVVETPTEQPASPLEAPIVEAKPDPGFVPITSLLDEREKRQRLEADLAQLRAQQQQPQAQEVPDVFDENYGAYQEQRAQTAALNSKLDISEEMARDKFGDEAVDQARDWALEQSRARPGFYQELIGQRNPYRYAVEQYRREQIASQVSPDDFAEFQAWKAANVALHAPQPSPVAAQPLASRELPPRSLASAPSAGGVTTEVAQSDEEIFAEVLPKR